MSKFSEPQSLYKDTPRYSTSEFENLMAKLAIGYKSDAELEELENADPQNAKKYKTEFDFSGLLKDLQANILLYHRRNFSRFYFIHFKNEKGHLDDAKKWIRDISVAEVDPQNPPALLSRLTSAKEQFEQEKEFEKEKKLEKEKAEGDRKPVDGKPVCCFYLTWEGYRTLGLKHLAPVLDNNKAFEQGMRKRVGFEIKKNFEDDKRLHPMVDGKLGEIHAMLMIASDKEDFSDIDERLKLSTVVGGGNDWAYVTIQGGLIKERVFELGEGKDKKEKIVEWFGFRDGVSQPLFFPDARPERDTEIKKFQGDSVAPLRMVLTRDRGGQYWYSAGSFLAFLKLGQNVKRFNENVAKIAKEITNNDEELAAAYIMGRFHDGTSVSLSEKAKKLKGFPENDFHYSKVHKSNADSNVSDEKGIRCPFAAHARKANPRDDKEGRYIVRRGVLYDDSGEVLNSVWKKEEVMKKENVGLLFMSFQNSLEKQFEYILNTWLLGVNTGSQATGVDMLVGTGFNRQFSRWYIPKKWGEGDVNEKTLFTHKEIEPCVHFKGGEYFFAPSISFLQKVESNSLIANGSQGGFKVGPISRK